MEKITGSSRPHQRIAFWEGIATHDFPRNWLFFFIVRFDCSGLHPRNLRWNLLWIKSPLVKGTSCYGIYNKQIHCLASSLHPILPFFGGHKIMLHGNILHKWWTSTLQMRKSWKFRTLALTSGDDFRPNDSLKKLQRNRRLKCVKT